MTWEAWLAKMGEPENGFQGTFTWDGGAWYVMRYNGRIAQVQRGFPTDAFADKETARAQARALMPLDAVFVEEYVAPASGHQIEVYHSAQLAAAYPDGLYLDTEPGTLMVSYWSAVDLSGNFLGYSSVNLATGNNP